MTQANTSARIHMTENKKIIHPPAWPLTLVLVCGAIVDLHLKVPIAQCLAHIHACVIPALFFACLGSVKFRGISAEPSSSRMDLCKWYARLVLNMFALQSVKV